ncbi:DUF4252 domain-containing protein [Tenacibaculum sp. IB213877]|uniref:DUF4252 domain-containing protein n=1 Tax=Tenacibaculum sp. IB213877 TaxID=3097351 RepID=UPI002A5A334F|nr:DUF4252 domain-containing protein [Tenacibaculum sp. IB213877]MDY0781249.1 DUF4252 domain-containing protein [Tenacibaculum sp. IB213877]
MRHLAIVLFSLFTLNSFAQDATFKTFYKANKHKSEFSINLPAFIANAFISDEDEDLDDLVKKAKNYKILVFENHQSSVGSNFDQFAKENKLKPLIKVKDNGEKVDIYFIERKDRIKEIIIKAHSTSELVFVALKTNLTKEEFATILGKIESNNSVASN